MAMVDWARVSRIAKREQSNRERRAPAISVFRWWARRPHSVMGAILDAAIEVYGPDLLVADPFSGGGTVTFEAVQRGLRAYAQDLYPWPARGLATALTQTDPDELARAAAVLLDGLHSRRSSYQGARGHELSHILRVRVRACASCSRDVHLFPELMVSLASRGVAEQWAYYGCVACGTASRRRVGCETFVCANCGTRNQDAAAHASRCPHCRETLAFRSDASHRQPRWAAVLVQELRLDSTLVRARIRTVEPGDPVDQETAAQVPFLRLKIPPGQETRRLLADGYRYWGDLYTLRQGELLRDALATTRELSASRAVKDRIAYAIIGCAEMPAYLSRWDRFHLKAFEGLANHRYSCTTLAVETNPLSPVGRGTLARRIATAKRALQWLVSIPTGPPKVEEIRACPGRVRQRHSGVVVATGSSEKQALQRASVHVTLSDPPYFDDVQYGELARLFHVWLNAYEPGTTADEEQEATPNRTRGVNGGMYEARIAACLSESLRGLRPDGRLILTFHNKKLRPWQALAGAIARAGFKVRALAVVRAENRADHCKRNVESMLHDLVLECVPGKGPVAQPTIAQEPRLAAEKNLIAMGLALDAAVRKGDTSDMLLKYHDGLAKSHTRKILIGA